MDGDYIKKLRLRMNLTQQSFGELLGYTMPQRRISELELGKKLPSNQTVAACKLIEENIELKRTIHELKKILEKT